MPPSAAMHGSNSVCRVDKLPSSTSRLISSPTRKKKIAIQKSLIQSSSGLAMLRGPRRTCPGISSSRAYQCSSGELLTMKASAAAVMSNNPADASSLKNRVNAPEMVMTVAGGTIEKLRLRLLIFLVAPWYEDSENNSSDDRSPCRLPA